ncbi:MAG: GntR family transcriptional regulator [Bryobacteraceae bacterium]
MFAKLTPHTLRGRIAHEIRKAILSGKLKEGERLVERKLATALGASLTAVREALIELESEGYVVKKVNLGTYVTKMTLEDVEKVYRVRRALEALAAAEAAQNGTPEQVEKLKRIYRNMAEAARAKDVRRFNREDIEWHSLVWEMTGNEYLIAALRRAVLPYFTFTAIRIASVDPQSLERDACGHLPLLEAIAARAPERARQAFAATADDWLEITRSEYWAASPAPAV